MSKELPPSRTADQFVVRLPDGMRDKIAEAAKAAGRSMNAEIVFRLEQSFEAPPAQAEPDRDAVWSEINALNRQKDQLTLMLVSAQTRQMQFSEELRSATVDGLTGEAVAELRRLKGSALLDMVEADRKLKGIHEKLDILYERASVLAPGAGRQA